jgi:hypothetical protein
MDLILIDSYIVMIEGRFIIVIIFRVSIASFRDTSTTIITMTTMTTTTFVVIHIYSRRSTFNIGNTQYIQGWIDIDIQLYK